MFHSIKTFLYGIYLVYRYTFGKTKKYLTGEEKNWLRKLIDLLIWCAKAQQVNVYYYSFGLNINNTKQRDFIDRPSFISIKNRIEKLIKSSLLISNLSYDVITKDKYYFGSILSANSISCLENKAVLIRGIAYTKEGRNEDTKKILPANEFFFIKDISLEASEGVFKCIFNNNTLKVNDKIVSFSDFSLMLNNRIWILQKQYKSHEIIRKVNSSALNTTRIVTILNRNEPEYLCGFQGFATGDAMTDSWSHGSVYVGIDIERSCLKEFGYTSLSDTRPGLLTEHPDSKIVFKDYYIPFIKEAVDLCIKAHRLLYFNFIIGWDVAITDDGPLIVEANEKPGMNVAQCVDGGLRKKIMEYAKYYMKG